MDATGSTREGWMAVIPITVIILVILYVVGGPAAFISIVQQWTGDFVTYISDVIRYL